jgi:MFS family permease
MSISYMTSSLLCGYLLTWLPFPVNYQLVFLIGFIGAMMSSYFLSRIEMTDKVLPVTSRFEGAFDLKSYLRVDIWKTSYRVTLLLLMAFHLAQYLAIPLFPIYFVRNLNLNDNELGIGTAIFYFAMLIGSAQLHRFVAARGNKTIVGVGVFLMAIYPILLALSSNYFQYYGLSFIGGYAWSFVGGASMNYIFEHCPADDRPAYLAWYNIVQNIAILVGSLSGPFISHSLDIQTALIAFGVLRGIAGLAILRWG